MGKIKKIINKLSSTQKISFLFLILLFFLLIILTFPSLAKFKNGNPLITTNTWNGNIAHSYNSGSGTIDNPYIISNGEELAYFYNQSSSNDYQDTYFELSNDIVLNDGIFRYDSTNGIEYILNGTTYYVDEYTNQYYDNINKEGIAIGSVNIFNSINGFKGHFSGKSFIIYGLYITDENKEELALFTDLQGSIESLYIQNSLVYGGNITGGVSSTSTSSSLNDVVFDGFVIGKDTNLTKTSNVDISSSPINVYGYENTTVLNLENNIPIGSTISSSSITGNYTVEGSNVSDVTIKINGITVSNTSFNIDLGNSLLESVSITTSSSSYVPTTLTLSNLKYNINYNYGVSGGLVAKNNNTIIQTSINKAYVYGYSVSGGLIGSTDNLSTINSSYNMGIINSNSISGGLIGSIENNNNNLTISKSYNTGETITGGLIGIISNSETVNINNVFNTVSSYCIGTINNTVVNITNSYYTNENTINSGTTSGNFTFTTIDDLKNKEYVTTNLDYSEFVDLDNLTTSQNDIWVYNIDALPILYIDDIAVTNINLNVNTWNEFINTLDTVKLTSNITFKIENADALNPAMQTYYYISNSDVSLTKNDLNQIDEWVPYNNIVQITEEGKYVIYAKTIDYKNNITYVNTDLLVLDYSEPSINISLDSINWTTFETNLTYKYLDREKSINISGTDNISGVNNIKYYITNEVLNNETLQQLNDSNWTIYSDSIQINQNGTYIIYAKVIDNNGNVNYANTDYLKLDGYVQNSFTIGRNISSYPNSDPYITDKSIITLNTNYANSSSYTEGNTHNIVSNILLPLNSEITLIDYVNNKVYKYRIDTTEDIFNYNNSCDINDLSCIKKATYPFTLFKEVGVGSNEKYFNENNYYSSATVNENFDIILDLSNTNILNNYNDVFISLEMRDSSNNNVRPTLYNSLKNFNIYTNQEATLNITTDYNGQTILYNSDSTTNINITSNLDYKHINDYRITDTLYEGKKIGILIKMVDYNGNVVDKEHLNSMMFKVGDKEYHPSEDNTVRIDLENGISDTSETLTIETYKNNDSIKQGNYYLKITNYISNDGYYYSEINNNELSIPIYASNYNNLNTSYSFDVLVNDSMHIINKNNNTFNIEFNVLEDGNLYNPNIRVSLYKKKELSPYNQDYNIVDLANYVSNNLVECSENVYYVSTNPIKYSLNNQYNVFELNLIPNNFENHGYKYVFELYDGIKKVGTVEKYFIVK